MATHRPCDFFTDDSRRECQGKVGIFDHRGTIAMLSFHILGEVAS